MRNHYQHKGGRLIGALTVGESFRTFAPSLILVLFCNVAVLSQAPPNDDFGKAIVITNLSGVIQGSTVGATLEQGEPGRIDRGPSVWWTFLAPGDGSITIEKTAYSDPPGTIEVFQGQSLSALSLVASNQVGPAILAFYVCTTTFDARAGVTYYIAARNFSGSEFSLGVTFTPAAANHRFEGRFPIDSRAESVSGSTVGATAEAEPGEPGQGERSMWWSWTPAVSGPVFLNTFGSAFDTVLAVYTGTVLSNLSLVAVNDDAYVWPWTNGPPSDPFSLLKFDASAGVTYEIVVGTRNKLSKDIRQGNIALNFSAVAIEEILFVERTVLPDRADFTADLKISNVGTNATGPLRIRLIAHAGYSYREDVYFQCPANRPSFDAAEEEIGVFEVAMLGSLAPDSSIQLRVSGRCPPRYEGSHWGLGYGVVGLLEEQRDGNWNLRNARLLAVGDWPRVGEFVGGPGGGAITIASAIGSLISHPAILDVRLGPASAVRLGAAWRISPVNNGEIGELRNYTNYTANSVILGVRSTNFTVEVRQLSGFVTPTNRTVTLLAGATVALDLNYRVVPPYLVFHPFTGLGVSGTAGTTYRLESTPVLLTQTDWSTAANVTLSLATNWVPGTLPARVGRQFYRAVWLPDQ